MCDGCPKDECRKYITVRLSGTKLAQAEICAKYDEDYIGEVRLRTAVFGPDENIDYVAERGVD